MNDDDQKKMDQIHELREQAYGLFRQMREIAMTMSDRERLTATNLIDSIDAGA
ncbi:hypothetical protein [Paraburkholderia sp. BCC1886]|uniref:hypothetical protein n=1 Tax=Paraburkholderia sp. BCC1886 TaxID=2562670 RepID=UPI001642A27A|nr:hypothetical protein [Paraburkholderia sp. BCC1886]